MRLGQLNGITRALPNHRLLIRSFICREAVLSSRIEGTVASLSDLYLFEMNPEQEKKTPDVREVSDDVRALDHGIERLKYAPFSLSVLKELHAILLEGVRGSDKSPGAFPQAAELHLTDRSGPRRPIYLLHTNTCSGSWNGSRGS